MAQPNDDGLTGTVKAIRSDKGFGFIAADGVDYFFHRSEVKDFDVMTAGTAVTFLPAAGPRGLRAVNVRVNQPPVSEACNSAA